MDVDAARDQFRLWSENPYFDDATRHELQALAGDEAAVADRFGGSLQFGTAGLRGLIGAGTRRINRYTIRQATQGLASYIRTFGPQAMQRGVVIAHDPRHCSAEFAREAALTLNTAGIVAYLWDTLRPTPLLSFAVRELGAMAGIMITASHNPKEYNGYKVYWADGGQVPPDRGAAIQAAIPAPEAITTIQPMGERVAREAGLLKPVPPAVDRRYMQELLGLLTTTPAERAACSVLYTPLHGTGSVPVQRALLEAGFRVSTVAGQEEPDPEFPTVAAPNPEDPAVFALARRQAELEQPDVILATDPDADRLGVLARGGDGSYRHLTGNEIGALLTDFMLAGRSRAGTLPANGVVIKSIATSNQVAGLCRRYGVELMETHVGFKYIGDKIREFEESGAHTFLLGFEESYGYLAATFVRDKDAVMAALLVAEAAAYHKGQGRTLCDALAALWRAYGCFREGVHSITLPGDEGQAQIGRLMERLRQRPPRAFAGMPVMAADDYLAGRGIHLQTGKHYDLALGRANVLHYRFPDGGFVMVRPSGTEPKLKLYVSVSGLDRAEANHRLAAVQEALLTLIEVG